MLSSTYGAGYYVAQMHGPTNYYALMTAVKSLGTRNKQTLACRSKLLLSVKSVLGHDDSASTSRVALQSEEKQCYQLQAPDEQTNTRGCAAFGLQS